MLILEFCGWLTLSATLMGLTEYWLHRLTMHKRVIPRGLGLDWIFEDHAVKHHKHERFDVNVDLPIYFHLILGSPLLLGLWAFRPLASLALLIVFLHHSVYWTKLHRATHGLEQNWTQWLPYPRFAKMSRHHLLHHEHPNRNFGVVYPWTDSLFGTRVRE